LAQARSSLSRSLIPQSTLVLARVNREALTRVRRPVRLASLTALAAVAIGFTLPAAGLAKLFSIGSLGVASISYAHPVDTAYWSVAQVGGTAPTVPRAGQVRVIHLTGCALPGSKGQSPLTQIHFQTLTALAGNVVRVKATSQPLNVPVCGRGATPATVTTFHPRYLCAAPGDYVAFNDEGGFGAGFPSGVGYMVFGSAAGAVTDSFTRAGGTDNAARMNGTPIVGVQLLLSYVLGTGRNARPYCR
jgi:hypothetical protein